MTTLTVGQGQQYATISAAVNASRDGDVIQVQAGTYTNDFATINTKITLQGVGGMVHMVATGDIPNDKGILIVNTDVTIDHFEFSGATGASNNAAGIRYQGGALTLTNDYFHDNQNGLMGGAVAGGTITIRNSEFANNGAGDGYTHNLYVGDIAKLTISDSYFHDAVVGHEIKSRAAETVITNTRIIDNNSTSSYSVDLPNGGKVTLSGNVIQQGPNGENPNIIAYGAEGVTHAVNTLTMTNNTVLNDMGRGTLVFDASGTSATLDGTKVWGLSDSQMASSSAVKVTNTTHLSAEPTLDTSHPWATSTTTPTNTLVGGATGDVIQGSAGDDVIIGGGGGDAIFGQAGADTIKYLSVLDSNADGSDGLFVFETGVDKVDLSAVHPSEVSLIRSGGSTFLFASTPQGAMQLATVGYDLNGRDVITGDGHGFYMIGDSVADTLIGGATGDVIQANGGDDIVIGGGGGDAIWGGAGADVFKYLTASDSNSAGTDTIFDFQSGVDKIDLSALRTGASDTLGIVNSGGSTFLFIDLHGDGVGDMTIQLNGTASITTSDYLF